MKQRICLLFLSILLISAPMYVYAARDAFNDVNFSFDTDVVLVLCGTESLHVAGNLFIDLTATFDSRVAIVTTVNESQVQEDFVDLFGFLRDAKDVVLNLPVPQGTGDVSAAIDIAVEMIQQRSNNRRQPVIAVITTESEAAGYLYRKNELNNQYGIKVVFVLLASENESSDYKGVFKATEENILDAVRDAFIYITGSGIYRAQSLMMTGSEQSVAFTLTHESKRSVVFLVTSDQPLFELHLIHNQGESFQYAVNNDRAGNYRVVSINAPLSGEYTLSFVGSADTEITITVLPFYDIQLVLGLPETGVQEARFVWLLQTLTGAPINDIHLISALNPELTARNVETGAVHVFEFGRGNTDTLFQLPAGDYEVILNHRDGGFVRTSNVQLLSVLYTEPIGPVRIVNAVYRARRMTIFASNNTLQLSDVIEYIPENEPLTIVIYAEEMLHDWSITDNAIQFIALHAGSTRYQIEITDAQGRMVIVHVDFTVYTGWIVIGFIAITVLVLSVVIMVKKRKAAPLLATPLTPKADGDIDKGVIITRDALLNISMLLPDALIRYTPPEARLIIPVKIRGKEIRKATLAQIIEYNPMVSSAYFAAFEQHPWMLNQIILQPKSAVKVQVSAKAQSGYNVRFDNRRGIKYAYFDINGGTVITFTSKKDSNIVYVIRLGNL